MSSDDEDRRERPLRMTRLAETPRERHATGVLAALASAGFLGMAPVLAKLAIAGGFSPLGAVALRTSLAALALLAVVAILFRQFLYIYPMGLVGCMVAGGLNGAGSLLYFLALNRLQASVGQLVFLLYPSFVAFWLVLDHHPLTRLTWIRTALSTVAILMLVFAPGGHVDFASTLMMLGAAVLYALHVPVNQRVLYDVPPPTVTLYTMLAMAAVAVPAYALLDPVPLPRSANWLPIVMLTAVMFTSRLLLFVGVQRIGGIQTSLLGLSELLVAIALGQGLLGERLTFVQWGGALLLIFSLLLASRERPGGLPRGSRTGWLAWIAPTAAARDLPLDR